MTPLANLSYFNSIKVRLRLYAARRVRCRAGDFNSIKVRLRQCLDRIKPRCFGFQFHKGTIETMIRNCEFFTSPKFQFHKGTIETYLERVVHYRTGNFNSIKVRLRLAGGSRRGGGGTNFNSIKVRLRLL